ncbi:MAG: ParA family protein [Acidimicrobiia bacterium]|nr:ParA family protein [Acidimicrobiia bacterium]
MAHVLSIANQKGGVGKTTTTHTLGAALAEAGHRVLLVDLDPQACLTYSVGLDPESLPVSLHDVLTGRNKAEDALVHTTGISIIPASIDLAGSELHLANKVGREHALSRALQPLKDHYEVILIDCPPSLGILTINGLTAADHVLIPLQCETLSHRGVGQLLETVADVRAYTQPDLEVLGVIATMFDGRTRHTREVVADISNRYGLEVLSPVVPRSVRFAEAPAKGRSVLEHAPTSPGAIAYRELGTTIAQRLDLYSDTQ